jgi:hypothetical protein
MGLAQDLSGPERTRIALDFLAFEQGPCFRSLAGLQEQFDQEADTFAAVQVGVGPNQDIDRLLGQTKVAGDPGALDIQLRLNGRVMQDDSTRNLIFKLSGTQRATTCR